MKIFIVILSLLAVSLEECQQGWRRFGNSCYRVFNHRTTFNSALRRCAGHQAYLLSVKNEWENSFIARIISRYQDDQFWIGIHFNSTSGYWLDDGSEVIWSKWVGPKTACPLMTGTAKWTPERCSYYHQYICELDLNEEKDTKDTTPFQHSSSSSTTLTSLTTVPDLSSITNTKVVIGVAQSTKGYALRDESSVLITDADTTPEVIFINRKKNPGRTHTDNRPSAIGIGSIGIAVLICVFLGVFLLDASKLWRDFAMFRHNMAELFRRFRRSKIRKNKQFRIENIQEHLT